jgi:kynureninase
MMSQELADKVAPIIGADPGTTSLHINVTTTQAVVASCFDFKGKRRKVVVTDKQFPSILYLWHAQQERGASIELVRSEEDPLRVPTQKLLDAIDDRTLLVPISHVLFRSGYVQDVEAIIEKAHSVGAHVLLDAYQSGGVLPVEAKKWNVDFVVGGTLKWLCGGPGLAYLYVRPDLHAQLKPTLTGWFAHKNPFDFAVGENEYTDQSYRFMTGTAQVPVFYAAEPGLDIINQVGIPAIREQSLRLTRRLIEGAKAKGWRVHTPEKDDERGGTVTLDVPNGYEVMQELLKRDFLVDYRPNAGVRCSPHFYNTDEEVDRTLDEIEKIVASQ